MLVISLLQEIKDAALAIIEEEERHHPLGKITFLVVCFAGVMTLDYLKVAVWQRQRGERDGLRGAERNGQRSCGGGMRAADVGMLSPPAH